MKKTFKIMVLSMAFALIANVANAQSDNYFSDWYEYREDPTADPTAPIIPESHGTNTDQAAPIGSGLVILAMLGAGYALMKKENE